MPLVLPALKLLAMLVCPAIKSEPPCEAECQYRAEWRGTSKAKVARRARPVAGNFQ